MNIFTAIEKLITEHGSASILRDHINLLKEKFSLLEKENKELESKLEDATKEIDRFNKLTQKPQRAAYQEEEKLNEVTEQILQQFFKTGEEMSPGYFASSLSLEISVIEYHFDILIKNGYIDHASSNRSFITGQSSTTYLISSKGREYIMKNT